MPLNPRIKKVLVIGSGPIVIGQAAEFDYAGTQACKALREEGIEVVLVNSNPATIMTDEDIADRVYIEPLTVPMLTQVIEREHPDGILGTLGGQTGLNLTTELSQAGALEGVEVLGTGIETIQKAEDRELFQEFMDSIGEPVSPGVAVTSVADARRAASDIGYPVVVRPAYTLGGTGGGVAYNQDQLDAIASSGIAASIADQVLIEKSLLGWKEIEYEVMRDADGNVITVCNMENFDPMGVHTGDSIVVAPSQTLSDKDYQRLRTAALRIIDALQIEGGCNVQFAYRPGRLTANELGFGAGYEDDGPMYYVIEVNPRVSRSSALASKATGYPIARVAAKIALGFRLHEIANVVTQKTKAAFEPALDYCVLKIPRWPFDKFATGDRSLGTQMKATGEVMAIDRNFESALMKAVRSLEDGRRSLTWEDPAWREGKPHDVELSGDDIRLWKLMFRLRTGDSPERLTRETGIDVWFIRALQRILRVEESLRSADVLGADLLRVAKTMGFTDEDIAELTGTGLPERVRAWRKELGIVPVYKMVDTCAGEFEAVTPYYYSTYEQENETEPSSTNSTVVIGSGPIRIGQGIEFDYCSVHAAWALRSQDVRSIMINSNPETVSTDFDTSDRLYFEPLDDESVRNVIDNETPLTARDGVSRRAVSSEPDPLPKVAVQFGGQTAINLSQSLGAAGLTDQILGTTPNIIDSATDRGRFEDLAVANGIPLPPGGTAEDTATALSLADTLGYPVLVRPSYVLGGRAMDIVDNPLQLERYWARAQHAAPGQTILIDRYLRGIEVEVDAVCDGEDVLIPGIMQHIERAGVHSGDSFAVYPAIWLSEREVDTVVDYTRRIGRVLGVRGLMNIQFVITRQGEMSEQFRNGAYHDLPDEASGDVFVLEVNPRSSRTMPFISKVTGIPIIKIGMFVMNGARLRDLEWGTGLMPRKRLVAVKAPVFSMSKLKNVDTFLGPEMKSTGEVMGIAGDYESAVRKALIASNHSINPGDNVLLSIADAAKPDAMPLIESLCEQGHGIFATSGTADLVREHGYDVTPVDRLLKGTRRNVVTIINDGTVQAVVNVPTGDRHAEQDGFFIRRAAVERTIPCFTSIDTAICAASVAHSDSAGTGPLGVKTLTEYVNG